MPWLRRDDRRGLRRHHLDVERESASGIPIEAHAVQGHRDRVREDVRDRECKRHSAGDGTALRGANHDGVAVRIDGATTRILRQEAAPDVLRLVDLAVREPHLGIYEIRAAAQVDSGQRDAGAGVRNRNSPLRRRRTVDLCGARITLRTLQSLRAGIALRTLASLPARVALRPLASLRSRVTLRPLSALRSRVALGPLRSRVALRPLGTNVAPITLGTLGTGVSRVTAIAVRTPAIANVAGTVPIHVFGGQVTLAILVQIPALEAVGTLWTGVALGANGTSVTLGTLSARIARAALGPARTARAVRASLS